MTLPLRRFPEGVIPDSNALAAGRYGTFETCNTFGDERTFEYQLKAQGQSAISLSLADPNIISLKDASKIMNKANLININPNRIREIEAATGHDVIAISTALEEVLPKYLRKDVGKGRTSADTTQPARALQLKAGLEIIVNSGENLRDILIEKALSWKNIPHMDQSHELDALPTVAGRPLVHYVEMLQSGLNVLGFFYKNSIMGKWADATGNHHQISALGVDGIALEKSYCETLGIGHMIAPAQIPGLEFEADIFYGLARLSATTANLADYVKNSKGSDKGIFFEGNPKKRKGSSSMPHKDVAGGNPTAEEQAVSIYRLMAGNTTTALMNCQMDYTRDLGASANTRINLEDGFKCLDHALRRMSSTIYWLGINEERAQERINRTLGVTTSNRVLAYLTDHRRTDNPLGRMDGHNLMGKLATEAWNQKKEFVTVLLENEEVTSRLDEKTIIKLANPKTYIGESRKIINKVIDEFYQKKTLTI
jgi:adenylosuccinate lyase